MISRELENLVSTGQLKRSPIEADEIAALIESGTARLTDADRRELSLESRFHLAYGAAHALAQAALRHHGYRSENRYIVFQLLPHTLGVATSVWRLLAKCHGLRNRVEYEGASEIEDTLVRDLIAAATEVREALLRLRTSSTSG